MRPVEWVLLALALLILMLVFGCATPQPRIVVREVKVAVPVSREPPADLKACGKDRPDFRFYATTDPQYPTGIAEKDEAKLREWVDSKDRCISAWGVWSKP